MPKFKQSGFRLYVVSRVTQPIFDRTITWLRARSRLFQCISRVYEGMFCVWHWFRLLFRSRVPTSMGLVVFVISRQKELIVLIWERIVCVCTKIYFWFWLFFVFASASRSSSTWISCVGKGVELEVHQIVCLWFWLVWSFFRSLNILKKSPKANYVVARDDTTTITT